MSTSHLDEYVQRLFAGVVPRDDRSELTLARPSEPGPLLLQSRGSLGAVALALELLEVVRKFGGSSAKSSTLTPLRQHLRERYTDSEWAHLEEELLHTLMWLQAAFDGSADVADEEDELRYPVEPRLALVNEALAEAKDLYVEYIRVDERGAMRFHRSRLRPSGVEPRDNGEGVEEAHVVGQRVPQGDAMAIALSRLRWLMVVRRLSPLQKAESARVLSFPPVPDADQDT